jgi:hypothetical protein
MYVFSPGVLLFITPILNFTKSFLSLSDVTEVDLYNGKALILSTAFLYPELLDVDPDIEVLMPFHYISRLQ